MNGPHVIDTLLKSIDLQVRRQHTEDRDLVIQRTLQCYKFRLDDSNRMKILERAVDPKQPALDTAERSGSLTPEEAEREEEHNSDEGPSLSALLTGGDGDDEEEEKREKDEEDEDEDEDEAEDPSNETSPSPPSLDVSRYKAGFEADWDYASRLVRDSTIGFFLSELAPAVTHVKQRSKNSISYNGITNNQIKRLSCVKSPIKSFGLVYDRFYPIAGERSSKKAKRTSTRVIPIHLIPVFFAAQTPKVHAYNATIPMCYQLIQKMETVRFNYEQDEVFLCCLEQLKINTTRIGRMYESKADSVAVYNTQLVVIDRQLTKLQSMIDESKANCDLATRLGEMEARLNALDESKDQQDDTALLKERIASLEKAQKTTSAVLRRHHSELKGKKKRPRESESQSEQSPSKKPRTDS